MAENHYIVSTEDLGDAWLCGLMEGLVRFWAVPKGETVILFSGVFSASHEEVNCLGTLEFCLDQLEIACLLFVHIFVFTIKRFLSLGRDRRASFPFYHCLWCFINLQTSHFSQPHRHRRKRYSATSSSTQISLASTGPEVSAPWHILSPIENLVQLTAVLFLVPAPAFWLRLVSKALNTHR